MPSNPPRIVVIGGGFAGLRAIATFVVVGAGDGVGPQARRQAG
jgi:succinate dehydrogenase/fumarate reductase flavoprotein subunit